MSILLRSKKTTQYLNNIMNGRHDRTELMDRERRRKKADLLNVERATHFAHDRMIKNVDRFTNRQ